MIPEPVIAMLLMALVIVSNIIGYAQGKSAGREQGIREVREARTILERWNLNRARITAILKRQPVHWYELPKFLRRDALDQQWRRR
jgi:hypothetical protein